MGNCLKANKQNVYNKLVAGFLNPIPICVLYKTINRHKLRRMAERPEDLNLPNSIVARIIKESLPDGINVSKEARSAIAKAASVFVLYATSCSNSLAMKANRKTISGPDVLSAMNDMEFERFVEPLKASLEGIQLTNIKTDLS